MITKILAFITIIIILLLSGCSSPSSENNNLILSDIACSKKMSDDCVVYIKENENYVPYYVLTKNFNNSNCVLLLRKFLLDDKISFNTSEIPAARYEGSVLDNFLEKEFSKVFDESFMKKLQAVEISTIKNDQLGKPNPETTLIKRRVFSLSYTELGMKEEPLEAIEGKKIPVFNDANSRIAYNSNGTAGSWWTRTAHNWGGDLAVGIAPDGGIGHGSTSSTNGVRPAFCLQSNTSIVEREDVIDDKTVYILE